MPLRANACTKDTSTLRRRIDGRVSPRFRKSLCSIADPSASYPSSARPSSLYVPYRNPIIQKEWSFVTSPKTLLADNYEWPFNIILPGDIPESVEGLPHSWIIYRLKASIERGLLLRDVADRAHVRIVRTFDPSALELAHAMVNVPFEKNKLTLANIK